LLHQLAHLAHQFADGPNAPTAPRRIERQVELRRKWILWSHTYEV
jgi:hypothetical protein